MPPAVRLLSAVDGAIRSPMGRMADMLMAIGFLLWGLWSVASAWPDPTLWNWALLGIGVLGTLISALNVPERVRNMVRVRFVKGA